MHKKITQPRAFLSKAFLAASLMVAACGGSGTRPPTDGGDDALGTAGSAGNQGAGGAAGAIPGAGGAGAVGGGPGGSAGSSGGVGGGPGAAGGGPGGGSSGAAGGGAGGGPAGGSSGAAGGAAGASGDSTSYFYHFTVDGCDTGRLTFATLVAMCAGLESATTNHNCALAARQEFFQEECPGTFQEAP